jgi:hypothetical protein
LPCSEELQGARIDFVKFTIQVYYSIGGENEKKIQSHWTEVERQES